MERIDTERITDFEQIRQGGFVYVDKTDIVRRLVDGPDHQFFLVRPPRFGKTLLLSTIQYLFEGRRDLFDGLAIADTDWDWEGERCPVLRLDMSQCTGDLDAVKEKTRAALAAAAKGAGVPIRDEESEYPSILFSCLIRDAAEASPTGRCVLLVDGYDKPVEPLLGTPDAQPVRDFLQQFYTTIKSQDVYLRFCLMTGSLKFYITSIFSGLNNQVDLTMSRWTTTLLGYTRQEVQDCFPEALEALANSLGTDAEGAIDALEEHCGGYRFDDKVVPLFDPVALGRSLASSELVRSSHAEDVPERLASYVRRNPLDVDDLWVDGYTLGRYEAADPAMCGVAFQLGYLTIAEVDQDDPFMPRFYRLAFPNREVEEIISSLQDGANADETGA